MKKIIKRVIISSVCLLLAAVLVMCGIMFFYYPHYKKAEKTWIIEHNPQSEEKTVMSCNLRCINPTDFGKKSWFYRADLIIKNIASSSPKIIGFQEATKWQYAYLCRSLAGYDSVIEYRDNAFNSEGCPIFYSTDCFKLIDKGSFWLSETPEVMSKDWNSACYRICSYVILQDIASEKQFVVFNTHLDHVSDEARINGIGVVLDKISQFGNLPSIIMGDFNCEEGSTTYNKVTESFLDAKYQTENTMKSCTYQDFGEQLDRECIDYFMISKQGIKAENYKVVDTTYDGVYPSDHFPICLKFKLD